MNRKSFTILELVVVIIIVGILVTIAIPTYQNITDDAKAMVCETNLLALQTALDIYAMENDAMPGDLTKLAPKYLEKAFAQILKQRNSWKTRLAYAIGGWEKRGLAYAGLLHDLAGNNEDLLHCPAAAIGSRSYGMNRILMNKTSEYYRQNQNIAANLTLIGDCDTDNFANDGTGLAPRHRHSRILSSPNRYGIGIGKDKKPNHRSAGTNRSSPDDGQYVYP